MTRKLLSNMTLDRNAWCPLLSDCAIRTKWVVLGLCCLRLLIGGSVGETDRLGSFRCFQGISKNGSLVLMEVMRVHRNVGYVHGVRDESFPKWANTVSLY